MSPSSLPPAGPQGAPKAPSPPLRHPYATPTPRLIVNDRVPPSQAVLTNAALDDFNRPHSARLTDRCSDSSRKLALSRTEKAGIKYIGEQFL